MIYILSFLICILLFYDFLLGPFLGMDLAYSIAMSVMTAMPEAL